MLEKKRLVPPGANLAPFLYTLVALAAVCAVCELLPFLAKVVDVWRKIHVYHTYAGTQMPSYYELSTDPDPGQGWSYILMFGMDHRLLYPVFAVCMLAFAGSNYLEFYRPSKSVYTMARVRSGLEIHVRCWALPLVGAITICLLRWVLTGLIYVSYSCFWWLSS